MSSPPARPNALATLAILWAALTMSVALYGVVLWIVLQQQPAVAPPDRMLLYALGAAAVALAGASVLLPRVLLAAAVRQKARPPVVLMVVRQLAGISGTAEGGREAQFGPSFSASRQRVPAVDIQEHGALYVLPCPWLHKNVPRLARLTERDTPPRAGSQPHETFRP